MFRGNILAGSGLLLGVILCSGAPSAHRQTVLASPLAYNRIDCKPPECNEPNPLLRLKRSGKAQNSPEKTTMWKRGELVKIKWHRNNHRGGFVRFSLVPISKINDGEWHSYTAFHYGCFESHKYRCDSHAKCGTDDDRYGYYQKIEVPKVFPDGEYVLTMVWFGGVRYDPRSPMFSNYYSQIQIKGGKRSDSYQPKFVPEPHLYTEVEEEEKIPSGYCLATSTRVGDCGGLPCNRRKATSHVPAIFNRKKPPLILYDKILEVIGN